MKGIVLAGGLGTRLWPITKSVSKQLLPVYDKPMIYYPIATLMAAGIRDILIISTPRDLPGFNNLLGSGSELGLNFEFKEQAKPRGLAESLIIGEDFIDGESVALILGDNIFHGVGLGRELSRYQNIKGAQIFGSAVSNPTEYGIVEFDRSGKVISLEEKPNWPKSNYAVPGLYFYDNTAVVKAQNVRPSARGEIEITAVNQMYLEEGTLEVQILPRGTAWFDTGTLENLYDASSYVRIVERRQGVKIGSLEELAWRQEWISNNQLEALAYKVADETQRNYLLQLLL
jgi:glucose-1-phosphate thymidylyltransferase